MWGPALLTALVTLAGCGDGGGSNPGQTPVIANGELSLSPDSIAFGNQPVGTESLARTLTIGNTGGTTLTVAEVAASPMQFLLTTAAEVPFTLDSDESVDYSVSFAPDEARAFDGRVEVTSDAASPMVVLLSGTGTDGKTGAEVMPKTVDFGSQLLNTTSDAQTVTITNRSASNLTVTGASTEPPFAVSAFSPGTQLASGEATTLDVTFTPTASGPVQGEVRISFDSLGDEIVALSGTGSTTVASLTITTSSLPTATRNSPYTSTLQAAGGNAPLAWAVGQGDHLPTGLTLNPVTGVLAGEPASPGAFPFTVEVTDASSPPARASRSLALDVGDQTGANCDRISVGFSPLTDLGTGNYLGQQGGLYPGGGNARPAGHESAGLALARSIAPLNANGNPDANGRYVLLSIGMSNATQEFSAFKEIADQDPDKDARLTIVDGAQGGAAAERIADPGAQFWSMVDNRLAAKGVTPSQVAVAWVKNADAHPSLPFPADAHKLRDEFAEIARILTDRFPNLRLAYFSSRIYAGYAVTELNPEPFAYQSGFAVKMLIAQQIDGDPMLNFDPAAGVVAAPWLSWGPYLWADGLNGRADGLVWTCQDLEADGTHPSSSAEAKVAGLLLDFFKTDSTAREWYLATP